MNEWLDNEKKISSNFHKLLQERIVESTLQAFFLKLNDQILSTILRIFL